MYSDAVRREEVSYGWVWVVKTLGIVLLILMTLFVCQGKSDGEWQIDFHPEKPNSEKPNSEPAVTVTASGGYISISRQILDNSNTVQVVSTSSVPVDIVVRGEDGRELLTYFGLMPGEPFCFEYEQPCTIVAAAS